MTGYTKRRGSDRNTIKIIGFVSSVAVAISLCFTGDYVAALGIVAASLSSPLNGEEIGGQRP